LQEREPLSRRLSRASAAGSLFANMISPKAPKQGMEQTRLERRMSPQPIQASDAAAQPVPYLAASQPPAPGVAAAVALAQAQPQPAQPQTETANSGSAAPVQAADTSAAPQEEAPATPAAAAMPVMRESTAASEDAMARARDADLKRVVEKRRIERRQQWTERRRLAVESHLLRRARRPNGPEILSGWASITNSADRSPRNTDYWFLAKQT
jgi:hypothetical protein